MLEVVLAQYGLAAIFIGTFFEGEIVVIASGLLSRLGFFPLPLVLITVFLATFAGDQTFFYFGRRHGSAFLEKRPHLKKRAERIHDLIDTHQNKILFGFRFLYGIRIPTLIALGTSSLPTKKFVILNLFNSVVWTFIFVYGGYIFGDVFTLFIDNVKMYEKEVLAGIALIAFIVWIGSIIKNREEYN